MTRRPTALAVALALVCAALLGGAGAGAGAGAATAATGTAKSANAARSAAAACRKRDRVRSKCRRARVAGYRRGARRGRALLAGLAARAPTSAARPVGGGPAGPAGPAPPSVPPAGGGSSTSPPPAPVASSVGAEAYDFGTFVLRLTRTAVPAGDLTIYFRNYDVSEHNLWLDPPPATGRASLMISEAVGEGGGATKTVAVTTGTWRLYCSLDGHGVMTRDLAVQ